MIAPRKVTIECDPFGFPCWVAHAKCDVGGRVAADVPMDSSETEIELFEGDFYWEGVPVACLYVLAYNASGESRAIEEFFTYGVG